MMAILRYFSALNGCLIEYRLLRNTILALLKVGSLKSQVCLCLCEAGSSASV